MLMDIKRKASVAILIAHKLDCQPKTAVRMRKGHYIGIKTYIKNIYKKKI